MNFNLSKKQLIILSSAIWVVLLWLVWYFVFFKNKTVEPAPTPVVDTTETNTTETSTPEQVELDYNEQYSWIFYDALQSHLLTVFNNIVKDTKKFSIYNENVEIKEKTARQFWLNSQLSAKITTERNLEDIIALSWDSVDLEVNTEEEEEEECEEDDEACLAEKAKNEVVKINIDNWKTEWSYNWLKWDFEWTIEVQWKYLNKSSSKQLNENTSFTFLWNFAWNNEEEVLNVESFVLKTDNADIDEKNNLDDYQILNKWLVMTKDTWLVFSKLSFVNVAYNLKDLFNKMQEEQVFDFSDTPFSWNIINSWKVEVTVDTEEDVESEEAIALEANWEEDVDDVDEEDTWTTTETEKDTNTEVDDDTNDEIDDDTNDENEELEEEILTPSQSVVETQKIYFRANKENLKTFIEENIVEISNTLRFFWVVDAPSFKEDSISISAIEWSIEITWEYVKFNFNSFVIDNINFTWKLDWTELKLYTPNSIISGTFADTIDLKIENTSNKKNYNVKIKNVKNWVLMTVWIEEKSWTIKWKWQLQIKSTYKEWNSKLPALYKAPETKKPQIKFELISDTYKKLLNEVSNQYIEKEASKIQDEQKKERDQERQKREMERNQQQWNQQQTNKNQPQRPTNQPQTQN